MTAEVAILRKFWKFTNYEKSGNFLHICKQDACACTHALFSVDIIVCAVANGTLEEDSKRASMDPDYATLKANQQGHTHNGRLLLNRPTQEENSISSNGNSVNIPQYEMFGASQKMNSSSLIYQEVGPISATDEVKEPQDYALPVTPTHSTIDYEIPVASDHVRRE